MTVTQRRGRRIMMEPAELDAFLGAQRTCRVATVSSDGAPHISPLWFVWDGTSLWLYSITRSKRWSALRRDPRVAVVVDAGEEYGELRGVELSGAVEFVGEAPRTGEPVPETRRGGAAVRPQELRHRRDAARRQTRLAPADPGRDRVLDFRKLG